MNYSGNWIPYVPQYTWYAGATYRLPIYKNFVDEIHLNANMTGTGRIYWNDTNSIEQGAYQLLNARVDYQFKSFTFGIWARNILNTKYLAFQFSALGNQYAQPGNPRLLGVSFSTKF
jgi:outer membrane receptor protein involved in Fe transport